MFSIEYTAFGFTMLLNILFGLFLLFEDVKGGFKECVENGGTISDENICFQKSYQKSTLPQKLTHVNVTLIIKSLRKVSMQSNSYGYQAELKRQWFDDRIFTNWSETENKKRVSENVLVKAWRPLLYIFDNLQFKEEDGEDSLLIDFMKDSNHNQKIIYTLQFYLELKCDINIEMFPFDKQICRSKWGSKGYFTAEVKYNIVENLTFLSQKIGFGPLDPEEPEGQRIFLTASNAQRS